MRIVPGARNRRGRDGRFDPGNLVGGEAHVEGAERLGELRPGARANERHDAGPLGEHPGDRELRSRAALLGRDPAQGLDHLLIPFEVAAGEAGQMAAEVARAPRLRSGEESARQHPVGGHPHAQGGERGEDVGFGSAADQRILDLEVGNGVDTMRAADRLGAHFREPDGADVSGFDHLRDRADGVLDRDARVDTAGSIDVDVAHAEPFETVGEGGLDGRGAEIEAQPRAVGAAQGAELDRQQGLPRTLPKSTGDEQLVVAGGVVVARVEQRDAGVEGGVDSGDALALVGGTVEVGHSEAAKPDGKDLGAGTEAARAAVWLCRHDPNVDCGTLRWKVGALECHTHLLETNMPTAPRRDGPSSKDVLVHEMLARVADKWTLVAIDALDDGGTLRFGELQRRMGPVSQKMLTKTLRQLERDGLVIRMVYAAVPPKVEYRLTSLGRALGKAVCGIWTWAARHLADVERARKAYDGGS